MKRKPTLQDKNEPAFPKESALEFDQTNSDSIMRILRIDKKGKIFFSTKAADEIFGQDLQGRAIEEIFPDWSHYLPSLTRQDVEVEEGVKESSLQSFIVRVELEPGLRLALGVDIQASFSHTSQELDYFTLIVSPVSRLINQARAEKGATIIVQNLIFFNIISIMSLIDWSKIRRAPSSFDTLESCQEWLSDGKKGEDYKLALFILCAFGTTFLSVLPLLQKESPDHSRGWRAERDLKENYNLESFKSLFICIEKLKTLCSENRFFQDHRLARLTVLVALVNSCLVYIGVTSPLPTEFKDLKSCKSNAELLVQHLLIMGLLGLTPSLYLLGKQASSLVATALFKLNSVAPEEGLSEAAESSESSSTSKVERKSAWETDLAQDGREAEDEVAYKI